MLESNKDVYTSMYIYTSEKIKDASGTQLAENDRITLGDVYTVHVALDDATTNHNPTSFENGKNHHVSTKVPRRRRRQELVGTKYRLATEVHIDRYTSSLEKAIKELSNHLSSPTERAS